ncbi:elongation of very long chain fatty acids protein 7 isoform X2 [Vespula pensylvanica]|nr:elongation of very long chain fatty acids protein 7 isoform X2 [Vespula pensylvanica]XP_043663832.1 elongation of very long chain fatty acids protein 7 isoform X2 [Vespula pensylvanica]XP_043663833.1 elongation of very long chain fatty acids protein 7 isoform X2 [Vespula pensylvanica]XP_043663834.1 elongation of very long chain fatty acids protein 7 isoform X2 [Vespula pensylvanica]
MNITGVPPIDKMANIYDNSLVRFWHFLFHDLSDPRTRNWFLVSSPVPGISILIGYHYFIHSWGPKYMEHRKPFQMKNVLVMYNLIQVLLSTWIFIEGLSSAWLTKYSFKCEPVDFSESPDALKIARIVHVYFLAKLTELLDTVFFVLRKKEKQVTFLHVYHHTVMPMIAWGATKYYPGGHGTFIGLINSFVHIVMYTYYLLAALLPQYQKYLWWKKYITTLQMGQFCLAFLHNSQLLLYDCGYPRWSVVLTLPNAIFFYLLFSDFYKMAYEPDRRKKSTTTANGKIESNGIGRKSNGNDFEDTSNVSSIRKIKVVDKGKED